MCACRTRKTTAMSAKEGGVARTSTTFVNSRALAHASHHATRSSVSYPRHAVRPRYSQRQKSTLTWCDACKRSGRRCLRGVKIRPGVLPRGRGHATACTPTLRTHEKGRVSGTQQRPPHSFPPTEAEDTAGRVHLPKKGVSHKKCSEGGGGKIHEDDPVEGRRRVGEEGEGVGSPQTPLYRNEHVTERRSDQ
jgi:hypothetical protein